MLTTKQKHRIDELISEGKLNKLEISIEVDANYSSVLNYLHAKRKNPNYNHYPKLIEDDPNRAEIDRKLKAGVPPSKIALRYKYGHSAVLGYVKRNNIELPERIYGILKSPTGEEITVRSVKQVAIDYNIPARIITSLLRGYQSNHRGWKNAEPS